MRTLSELLLVFVQVYSRWKSPARPADKKPHQVKFLATENADDPLSFQINFVVGVYTFHSRDIANIGIGGKIIDMTTQFELNNENTNT